MKKRKIGFFALLICLLLSLPVSAAETKKEGWQKASNGVAYYYKNGKIAKGFDRIKTVSYTHLDVYKRQMQTLYLLLGRKRIKTAREPVHGYIISWAGFLSLFLVELPWKKMV